jgi:hypothetical protein
VGFDGQLERALDCSSEEWGPVFGSDISVYDDCNTNTESYTRLWFVYTNDTGLSGETVFTGSEYFKVKEIEVFEITD